MTKVTQLPLQRYRTWLFDCDGVLLDSNRVKTEAFRSVGARYGAEVAERWVAHHVNNGGASRYAKVDHLFAGIIGLPPAAGEAEQVLAAFATAVREELSQVEVEPHLHELLDRIDAAGATSFVVSGGDQAELLDVLDERGIAHRFTGIHGSPRTKQQILRDLKAQGVLVPPVIFIGDSALDHTAAQCADADFAFVTQWSEFAEWRQHLPQANIRVVESLGDLVNAWSSLRQA